MEDYLARLLNLTSYISHSIIQFIGDIVLGSVERISCDPEPSFSGWCGRTLFPDYSDSITEDQSVNRSWTVVLSRAKLFICRGLMMFPLYGLILGAKFVAACFKHGRFYIRGIKVRAHGFIRRLRRTLQGSTDDIGWLQRTEGLPPVKDGTARFKEVLCDVRYFTVFSAIDKSCEVYLLVLFIAAGKQLWRLFGLRFRSSFFTLEQKLLENRCLANIKFEAFAMVEAEIALGFKSGSFNLKLLLPQRWIAIEEILLERLLVLFRTTLVNIHLCESSCQAKQFEIGKQHLTA